MSAIVGHAPALPSIPLQPRQDLRIIAGIEPKNHPFSPSEDVYDLIDGEEDAAFEEVLLVEQCRFIDLSQRCFVMVGEGVGQDVEERLTIDSARFQDVRGVDEGKALSEALVIVQAAADPVVADSWRIHLPRHCDRCQQQTNSHHYDQPHLFIMKYSELHIDLFIKYSFKKY